MKPKKHYPVGLQIRDIRKKKGITQEELAAWLIALHAPITRNVIANWESGRSDVPAFCIQLIAFSFEMKIEGLLPDLTVRDLIVGRLMPSFRKPRRQPQSDPSKNKAK